MNSKNEPFTEILLVEDNEHDVILTRECFQLLGYPVNLHHVENGEECLAFLRNQGKHKDAPPPELILLDLNLPVMDGREALAEIVKDDMLNHIPVLVLTTSDSEHDVLQMYKLRCNSYFIKPVDFNTFLETVAQIYNYWKKFAVLPPRKKRD